MKNSTKIIVLWGLLLLGLTFHSLLEMMPLFFGADISMPGSDGSMPGSMAWMCLVLYLIPMLCMMATLYLSSAWYKVTNLVLAALFTVINAFHLIEEIGWSEQLVLLTFVLFVSVLLTIASYRWLRGKNP
ncbi:MAG: hypothetical protein AB2L24_12455 [Mangrovibacterium sp.]